MKILYKLYLIFLFLPLTFNLLANKTSDPVGSKRFLPPLRPLVIARTNADVSTSPIDIFNQPGDLASLDTTSLKINNPGPARGTVSFERNPITGTNTRRLIYTPNPAISGLDFFTYTICTKASPKTCFQGRVEVTILPRCNDDIFATKIGLPISVNVLFNDRGSWDLNQVNLISSPTNGTVVSEVNSSGKKTGNFIYTPKANFSGLDTFSYRACDNTGPSACDQALVFITVNPLLNPDSVNILASNSTPEIFVLNNDLGNLDPSTVRISKLPPNKNVTVQANGSVIFTPDDAFSGIVVFNYSACDLNGLCGDTTITVKVFPKLVPDTVVTHAEIAVTKNVIQNDFGFINSSILTISRGPKHGKAMVIDNLGNITYIPDKGFTGRDSIKYRACDLNFPTVCSDTTLLILVAPRANPDTGYVALEKSLTVQELKNDIGNLDVKSVQIKVAPINGTATIDPITGNITYTPKPGFSGIDSLMYGVCDIMPLPCDGTIITFFIGIPKADIKITKVASLDPNGYLGNYTVTLFNKGPEAAYKIQMLDVLPLGSEVILPSLSVVGGGSFTYNDTTRSLIWKKDTYGLDTLVTLRYQLRYNNSGTFKNTAIVNTKSIDPNLADNTASATITIQLPPIKIPNVFTPNGDGINDYLEITGLSAYPENTLEVFNRWGNVVYHKDRYGQIGASLWNGNGLAEGTYYIALKLKKEGKTIILSRDLTLIRHK